MIPLLKVHVPPSASSVVREVLQSGYIAQGPKVEEFEAWLSKRFGKEVLATSSCTAALHLALRLAGVKGGEVISTPLTCAATNMAIMAAGAWPRWADVGSDLNISVDSIADEFNENTRAVMVVPWGGLPVDMQEINFLANEHDVPVIVDAAHAFGSRYYGLETGLAPASFTAFSFQAIKILTTGDGGALVCRREKDHELGKRLRWFGLDRRPGRESHLGDIQDWGYKFQMNDIAAAIGLSQIPFVDDLVKAHQANSLYYDTRLNDIDGIRLPQHHALHPNKKSSCWLYTMLVKDRDQFIARMTANDIQVSQVHSRNDFKSCFEPVARHPLPGLDRIYHRFVCIPVGWWVTVEEREYIVATIKEGW